MTNTRLSGSKLTLADIGDAIGSGSRTFSEIPVVSMGYAAVFAVLGLVLLIVIGALGVSPLALPFAGGFMLLGPILLTGYFELANRHKQGEKTRIRDAFDAFAIAPPGLWLIALLCAFLFLIWITDAGVLYSFMIGGEHLSYTLDWLPRRSDNLLAFAFWGALMGSALAYMIFAISAFSVPLVYERRTGIVQGINISVTTVLGNFSVCLAWGIVLSVVILLSILLLPLLLVSLPIMSYASLALYRSAFPTDHHPENTAGEANY